MTIAQAEEVGEGAEGGELPPSSATCSTSTISGVGKASSTSLLMSSGSRDSSGSLSLRSSSEMRFRYAMNSCNAPL